MNKRQKDACTVLESGINYFGRVHYSGKQPEYQAWDINTDWDKHYFITGICNTQVPKLPLLSPSQSSISAILSVPSGPQALGPAPRGSCCSHMLSNSLAARSQPTSHCHKTMQLHAELASTQQTAVPALSTLLGTQNPSDTSTGGTREGWDPTAMEKAFFHHQMQLEVFFKKSQITIKRSTKKRFSTFPSHPFLLKPRLPLSRSHHVCHPGVRVPGQLQSSTDHAAAVFKPQDSISGQAASISSLRFGVSARTEPDPMAPSSPRNTVDPPSFDPYWEHPACMGVRHKIDDVSKQCPTSINDNDVWSHILAVTPAL